MKKEECKPKKKLPYVKPKVIATYEKEELEETINAQGSLHSMSGEIVSPPNGSLD